MKYSHIIFDIDGTILDTEKAVLVSLQDMLREVDRKYYSIDDLRFALGIPGITALNQLGLRDMDHAYYLWNEFLKKHLDAVKIFPGIEDLIESLNAEGFKLGIITSKNQFEYNQDFVPFGLGTYFDIVICMEDSARPKPYPDPMLSYLKKAGVKTGEALYIGDTSYDAECSNSAGVDFALAGWGFNGSQIINAKYYLNTPGEVLEIVI